MNWKTILDQSNLKIAQKGFILVLVPLILGLIFIGILLFLLNQAELARSREAHARKVISLANTVNAHALDGIQFLTGYVLTRSETIGEHYDQVVAKLPAEFQDLSEETRGDSVESKLVEQMRSIVERAVK